MDDGGAAVAAGMGLASMLCGLVIGLAMAALMFWKVFEKAGKPGWASMVPIYNAMVLAEVAGRPSWWGLVALIPCLGLITAIPICLDIAKRFGQGVGFAIGLILLGIVCFPILGFGDAKYNPAAGTVTGPV